MLSSPPSPRKGLELQCTCVRVPGSNLRVLINRNCSKEALFWDRDWLSWQGSICNILYKACMMIDESFLFQSRNLEKRCNRLERSLELQLVGKGDVAGLIL